MSPLNYPSKLTMEKRSPYQKSKNLLTKTEADFYVYLKAAVNNDFHINKMTRMCDLVDVDKSLSSNEYMSYFRSISQYHIDFTLCDPFSFKPLLCIELDDPTHDRDDRIKRDIKVNKIFADINLPLLRIKAERTYSVENIRNLIEENLDRARRSYSKDNYTHTAQDKSPLKRDLSAGEKRYYSPVIWKFISIVLVITISIVLFKNLTKNSISAATKGFPKSSDSKQTYIQPQKQVLRKIEQNKSTEATNNKKELLNIVPGKNTYTIEDVTISTRAISKPANPEIKDQNKEIKITPKLYSGNYTTEFVWEGNYKSGNGIIALLDCETQYLLIEQLASGIQIEHTVEKLRKETQTELQPIKEATSQYYVITSYGSLQEWDSSGMVNEFKRRS